MELKKKFGCPLNTHIRKEREREREREERKRERERERELNLIKVQGELIEMN